LAIFADQATKSAGSTSWAEVMHMSRSHSCTLLWSRFISVTVASILVLCSCWLHTLM